MPYLADITYSQDATVKAVRDYYHFLAQMYLDEDCIREPPVDGWPEISTESLLALDKSDEVVSLLRRLPYLDQSRQPHGVHGAPRCTFSDWAKNAFYLTTGDVEASDLKVGSEGDDFSDSIPSHVISLTDGVRHNPVFLLDTHLGVVYWLDCPSEMRSPNVSHEPILDDVDDYSAEEEAEWRGPGFDTEAWAVADFFEALKHQFCLLNFCPLLENRVELVWGWQPNEQREAICETVQHIYRDHGWPNMEQTV